jgi:Rho GTPase-activating protein 1
MSGMRAKVANRLRSSSLSAVPPPRQSSNYSTDMAKAATSILYRSPIPSREGRPVFILNAAAMPDTHETDFDSLLPYVLARLPEEDDLLKGYEYEVVFFAGDGDNGATTKKHRPGWGWFLQAYHVLSRAMRKRLQKLYIVHEKAWVRILTEIFSTIVSPKFRRKIYHCMCPLCLSGAPTDVCSLQPDQPRPKHPDREPPHTLVDLSHRSPHIR